MPISKSGYIVGLQYVQAWRVGGNGFAYGKLGKDAADAALAAAPTVTLVMAPLLLQYAQAANVPTPARVIKQLTGGDKVFGSIMFGPSDFGSFPLTLGNFDGDFHALASDSTLDSVTNSRWNRVSDNINKADLPQCGLLLSTQFVSTDAGSDGEKLWVNYLIGRCQIQPGFAAMSFQAEGPVSYTVAPSLMAAEPHGLALSAGATGVAKGKTLLEVFITPKPLSLTTALMSATGTVIQLPYKPTSTVVTLGNAANEMVKNGTKTALASATLLGVATLSAAGALADRVGILSETDFEAA